MNTSHILVVDDDPTFRQMLADYLTDYDIRVTTLAGGRDSLRELKPVQVPVGASLPPASAPTAAGRRASGSVSERPESAKPGD